MIANDNERKIKMNDKVEGKKAETKAEVKEPEIKTEDAKKAVNDDYQVILDDRGLYKIGGKWWVKIRRINVQEMITGWGIISSVFGNVQSMGLNLKDPQAWMLMFVTALPVVPGKFYQFLAQIMELQYDEGIPQDELKVLRDEYNNYLRRSLEAEELLDVLAVVYKQEEKRIDSLVKKAQSLFGPVIKMMAEKQKK